MISIRTALVVAAFVAMGLTSVAERLAETDRADPDLSMTIGTGQEMPGKGLRLTRKTPAAAKAPDLSPWI